MKIPIENIYYLLCYAWDVLEERDIVDIDPLETTNLADLFAKVLANGTHHLVKRGFDRGYVPEHEWVSRLRGRVCFEEAVRVNRTQSTRLPCEYDDLSHDVLHNQILKATMRRLTRVEGISSENAEGLAQLCRRLSDVRDIEVTNRLFGQVQLHRNNSFYNFLLKVCELAHNNLLPSEKAGRSKFRDFIQDEHQMRTLFEEFVRSFYKIHTDYAVKREDIRWQWTAADQVAAGLLPKMQTDVSLTSATRKIIVECKFTPEATKRHHEAEKLRREHLFQIHAYLSNLPEEPLAKTCEMILLYPTVESTLALSYAHKGHKIRVHTINLRQSWQGVHSDLLSLIEHQGLL